MARRLNTNRDVRRYLASIAGKVEAGEMDTKTADTLTRILNAILISIKQEMSERELEAVEEYGRQLKGA
ncbi:hypothetical protein [Dethiobacter alkaliphilus]|uniref:Uncharacterized protein n=1 Tax=Dethiobacter alkaliphilus AHT 1 TaxID=555088 RepID=C0GET7_DETAL|nr:hypothetical protein [Dethiobacter alkaliphilus]EEG78119.1 hypothetical protein DealDRAFT_0996 [Dethiobacter alkaliphilus AHT 1]